jgi:hypothetical protein
VALQYWEERAMATTVFRQSQLQKKSMVIVGNSLHPLAIILLSNSTPPPIAMGGLKFISDSPWMLGRVAL